MSQVLVLPDAGLQIAMTATTASFWAGSFPDWATAVGTVGATVAAVVLGLGFKEWWFRPRLTLRLTRDEGTCLVVTSTTSMSVAAYVRCLVGNTGRSTAKSVRVSLISVETWHPVRLRWERLKWELDGRDLAWSSSWASVQPLIAATAKDIAPRTERPLDFLSIHRDGGRQGQLPIRLEIPPPVPANAAHVLLPGAWRVRLELSADNAAARTVFVAFRFDGSWLTAADQTMWDVVHVSEPSGQPQQNPS
jgi:hypothetical protein